MTARKSPVVQQVAQDAAAPSTAPSAADVAKAEKEALKEQAAAEGVRQRDLERGYTQFLYHGVPMFRLLDAPDRTFETEREAMEFVSKTRVAANLSA